MRHRNLILLISILFFVSCNEITKNDIKGNWIVIPSEYGEPIFSEINFEDDKAELIGDNLFKESGVYKIEKGNITIKLNRDDLTIKTKIQKLVADTLLIFDNLTYQRNRGIKKSNFEEYELIGMPTNNFLSKERNLFHLIHFYKSNGQIQIRCGDKKSTFEDIPLFLEGGHSKPQVLIFLSKEINLKDLKRMYYRLASVGQLRIWLATKREGVSDTHIFKDKIEIWWEDLENHMANSKIIQPPPPPPPLEYTSKSDFIKKGGREIDILHKNDFNKIAELDKNRKYVISINQNLPIEEYFELKKKIWDKRKINKQIITEIE